MTPIDSSSPVPLRPVITRGLDGRVFANAQQTDPRVLGWMQGEPVPPDKRIAFADGSNYRFPQFRWSFAYTRELVPTRTVARADQPGAAFTQALDAALWNITFQPMTSGAALHWTDMLAATYTDAIVVLHQGRVVLEHYSGVMHPQALHVMMSVSKSVAGLLAAELAHQGLLDPHAPVTHYLPEMQASGFAGATVRQVMDMTTGIDYSENYADPQATIWSHMYAGGMLARPPGAAGPDNFFSYMPTVGARGEHGAEFTYRTVNTDVLGWILRRVAGCNFSDLVSQRLWQPMGAELDA
jgi:CubicO group peptidase (beta-lactamase class C family)